MKSVKLEIIRSSRNNERNNVLMSLVGVRESVHLPLARMIYRGIVRKLEG